MNKIITKTCLNCGKEFPIYRCRIKHGCGKYCSKKCMNESAVNKNKGKMSELRKRGFSYGAIGKIFGISRQRAHQITSDYKSTANRPIWLNKFFETILQERDNNTCQICGEKAVLIHHIDKNNSNNNPTNLISLCNNCHLNLHRPTEQSKKARTEKECLSCGKKFMVLPSGISRKYCGQKCWNLNHSKVLAEKRKDKQKKAIELRERGFSYDKIAKLMNNHSCTIWMLINKYPI